MDAFLLSIPDLLKDLRHMQPVFHLAHDLQIFLEMGSRPGGEALRRAAAAI